ISFSPGINVSANVSLEDSLGRRSTTSPGMGCRLRAWFALSSCNATIASGSYQLELPADAAVISAKASGHGMFPDGVQIDGDTKIEIVLGTPGAVITGVVKNSKDERISDAVVALVPDAPMRAAGPLYRTGGSDINGGFELRAIAPGAYHLFA